jgi:hypothetical protein
VRENFTQGSVRGEPGDRLSYRVAIFLVIEGFLLLLFARSDASTTKPGVRWPRFALAL